MVTYSLHKEGKLFLNWHVMKIVGSNGISDWLQHIPSWHGKLPCHIVIDYWNTNWPRWLAMAPKCPELNQTNHLPRENCEIWNSWDAAYSASGIILRTNLISLKAIWKLATLSIRLLKGLYTIMEPSVALCDLFAKCFLQIKSPTCPPKIKCEFYLHFLKKKLHPAFLCSRWASITAIYKNTSVKNPQAINYIIKITKKIFLFPSCK